MLVVGSELLQRADSDGLMAAAMKIAESAAKAPPTEEWKVLNVLQKVYFIHAHDLKISSFFSDRVQVRWVPWTSATDLESQLTSSKTSMSSTFMEQ